MQGNNDLSAVHLRITLNFEVHIAVYPEKNRNSFILSLNITREIFEELCQPHLSTGVNLPPSWSMSKNISVIFSEIWLKYIKVFPLALLQIFFLTLSSLCLISLKTFWIFLQAYLYEFIQEISNAQLRSPIVFHAGIRQRKSHQLHYSLISISFLKLS